MKKNQTTLLSLVLLLIAFCNTAFIISPKQGMSISTSKTVPTPPPSLEEYQSKKIPFFEQLIRKIMDKKLDKARKNNNPERSANTSIVLGSASLLSNIGIILLWQTSSASVLLMGLLLPALLGLISILISIMVISNISATSKQKKRAKIGILLGSLGLILGIILFAVALFTVAAA